MCSFTSWPEPSGPRCWSCCSSRTRRYVVSYQHLLELIEANQKGAVGVRDQKRPGVRSEIRTSESSGNDTMVERIRLSNLRDVKIGDRVVRGLVDIE